MGGLPSVPNLGVAAEFTALSSIIPGYVWVKFRQCHKFGEFNAYLRKFPKMLVPPNHPKLDPFPVLKPMGFGDPP